LTPTETAASLGVSRRFLYDHVLPELRVVRVGRCRLVPVSELRAWVDANAARAAS
jgi:excisionase family DNA binding protein